MVDSFGIKTKEERQDYALVHSTNVLNCGDAVQAVGWIIKNGINYFATGTASPSGFRCLFG
ncbi:hypothetical protein GCM10027347_08560 [Larkinella harenae]